MKKLISVMLLLALASVPALAAKYASVKPYKASIHAGASNSSKVKWNAWKYTPLLMLGTSKDKKWVQVKDFAGHTGWIYYSNLSNTKGVSAKTDLKVHKTPSAGGATACKVGKGYSFMFIKKQKGWIKVSDWPAVKGDPVCVGWVSASNVWAPAAK